MLEWELSGKRERERDTEADGWAVIGRGFQDGDRNARLRVLL